MSHWHYQLMYHKGADTGYGDASYYAIHEYYTMGEDGDGWTEDPVEVMGESVDDLKKSLSLMLNDIDKHGVKDYA